MAAELEIVKAMKESPGCCTLCGCAPVDETTADRKPLPAIHVVGADVNWGDHIYICWVCVGLMADMADRPSEEKVQKVISQAKFQKKRADKAEKKYDALKTRVDQILAGKKAVKAVKEEVASNA